MKGGRNEREMVIDIEVKVLGKTEKREQEACPVEESSRKTGFSGYLAYFEQPRVLGQQIRQRLHVFVTLHNRNTVHLDFGPLQAFLISAYTPSPLCNHQRPTFK